MMKKTFLWLCTKLAACACLAAMFSVNTASMGGLYEPEMPEALRK